MPLWYQIPLKLREAVITSGKGFRWIDNPLSFNDQEGTSTGQRFVREDELNFPEGEEERVRQISSRLRVPRLPDEGSRGVHP